MYLHDSTRRSWICCITCSLVIARRWQWTPIHLHTPPISHQATIRTPEQLSYNAFTAGSLGHSVGIPSRLRSSHHRSTIGVISFLWSLGYDESIPFGFGGGARFKNAGQKLRSSKILVCLCCVWSSFWSVAISPTGTVWRVLSSS